MFCFSFCGSQSILLVLPSGIPSCYPFLPLLVVVGRGHIHSALDFIFVLAAVILTPNTLIYFRVGLIISCVFKAPFGEAVRFAAGCSWGLLTGGIFGSLFLEGGCQSDDC